MQLEYDLDGLCWAQGLAFEDVASLSLMKAGVEIRNASHNDDYYGHTDFFAYSVRWGRWVSVDAKAMKRITRRGSKRQDTFTYVEWTNTAGYDGWLRKGADVILFEREDDMISIARNHLLAFCEERINQSKFVDYAGDSLYCMYSRDGRDDVISMIRLTDLPEDKIKIWSKL